MHACMHAQVDIFSEIGGSGAMSFASGDRQNARLSLAALTPRRNIFYYPFDTYEMEIE